MSLQGPFNPNLPPQQIVQPVAPVPIPSTLPPGDVGLPFQPPLSYVDGQFTGGRSLLELIETGYYNGTPAVAIEAASIAADAVNRPSDDIRITVFDNVYRAIGELNDYISLTFQLARNAVGSAEIVIKGSDPLVATVLNCAKTVVPITIETGTVRYSGRVHTAEDKFTNSINTVVVTCISDYAWLSRILCWPAFLAPLALQFPSTAVFIGPAITCIKTLVAEQCFRLQSGIWEMVNSLTSLQFNWETWFGTLLMSNGNLQQELMTPIVVVPTNFWFDTSPWVSFSGRMDQLDTLIAQVCKDSGITVTMQLWLPGDPQPTGLRRALTQATIVMDAKSNLNVTGPTGTFLDGIIQDVVDLENSALGQVLAPFLNPQHEYAPQGINIAPKLGVNFVQPWVVMIDDPSGGALQYSIKARHALCHTVVAGGKSPQWINDLLNLVVGFAISTLSIIIGISGIPSDLFSGVIDDVLLAFWRSENFGRRQDLGPYGFPEYFCQTGSSAYTLDSWFAMQNAMWETRGQYTYQYTAFNGYPYTLGVDIHVGQMASFASRGLLYTDYVNSVVFTDDRTTRLGKMEITVGDGSLTESPLAKLYRKLVNFEKAFQIITLSSH